MSGPGAKYAPVADELKQSTGDRQYFIGALWLMAPGSWQVRLSARGSAGPGTVSVPIPAVALRTKTMDWGLGSILLVLLVLLAVGIIAMVRSGVREAELRPGEVPDLRRKRAARRAAVITAALVIGLVCYGANWWNRDARLYGETVFKPLQMHASLAGDSLLLHLKDPGWIGSDRESFGALPASRSLDDLVPDHGHLMHLYMLREPALDVILHVHPEQMQPGEFRLDLPDMPAGEYKLYADVVHENGLPETLVSSVRVPSIQTHAVSGDDAFGTAPPVTSATTTEFQLADGYRMQWMQGTGRLRAHEPMAFRFRLLDPQGRPPADMQLYMGMLGHAAFVKPDGSVFAHIHPTGSVAMAAFMQANGMPMNHSMMDMSSGSIPNEVSFPYGFPSPGHYRIIVQMKHGSTIETGVFDATAD